MFNEAIRAMRDGNHAVADAAADAALAENPQHVDALYLKGLVRLGLGEHEAARAAFEKAIEVAPERADIHMALASLSVAAGRLEEAERASLAATKGDPNHLPAYVSLAHIHMARGDLDQAERFVNLAGRVAADHSQTLLAKGHLAHMRGDNDAALGALNKAVALAPNDVAALTALGLVYLAAGHAAFAEQALRRAIEHQPESRRSRWALVSALRAQGRAREALEEMDAVAQGRRDGWLLAQRSMLLLELGRDDEAVTDFVELLKSASLHPRVIDTVVSGAFKRGRPQVAERVVENLLEANAGHEGLWRHRVRIAAECQQPIGPVVQRWLAATPDSGEAHQLHAMWLESQGDLQAAEAAADRALQSGVRVDAAEMVKLRAEVRNAPAEACAHAERMLEGSELAPFRRETLRLKGLACDAQDAPQEAIKAWTRMLGEAIPGMDPPRSEKDGEATGEASADAAASGRTPTLLWGAPASDVPQLARWIRTTGDRPVCDDRFGPRPRSDGFQPRSGDTDVTGRGWDSWSTALQASGQDPARAIDWLPHWDPATDRDLPACVLVAAVRDPRDMLLNWWVFGGFPSFRFPGADEAAQWLEQALTSLVRRHRRAPQDTIIVRMDGEGSQSGLAALHELANAGRAGKAPAAAADPDWSLGGFPAGTWQRYQEVLGKAFERLAPVARELGY